MKIKSILILSLVALGLFHVKNEKKTPTSHLPKRDLSLNTA